MYSHIPQELKALRQWVCWRLEDDLSRPGKKRKVPVDAKTLLEAKSNTPSTWADFDVACAASAQCDGIGFMFASGYFGVDIDHCGAELRDYLSGERTEDNIVCEFLHAMPTYAEVSFSGEGLHIIARGKLPQGGRRKGNVEMYESGRFFVMTGNSVGSDCIEDCTQAVAALHKKYLAPLPHGAATPQNFASVTPVLEDEELFSRIRQSPSGAKFDMLWRGDTSVTGGDHSAADLALCGILAFWTGRDESRMDQLFRQSGLMRPKWDAMRGQRRYGEITISQACSTCTNVYTPEPLQMVKFATTAPAMPVNHKVHTFDDIGSAQKLKEMFGTVLRYHHIDKSWLVYDGRRWEYDSSGAVSRFQNQLAEDVREKQELLISARPENIDEDVWAKAVAAYIKSIRSNKTKSAYEKEARALLPVQPEELDAQPSWLNMQNGILDLDTGELMPHAPHHMLTHLCGCEYTTKSDCPLWDKFLYEIFNGRTDLIDYLYRALGYSLCGDTSEQCIFICLGNGKNGKSVLLSTIAYILGDYAMSLRPDSLMVQRFQSSANSDIARLKGARFVRASESNDGARFDEGLIKQLTGGEEITARKLYGNEFQYKPTYKLWLDTNNMPYIRGTDDGIWRRIIIIPFEVFIPEEKRDPHLLEKLREEAPAILAKIVCGNMSWRKNGLQTPQYILDLVAEYRRSMDVIGQFIAEHVTEGPGIVRSSELYQHYSYWCSVRGDQPCSGTKFGLEIGKRLMRKRRDSKGWFFEGYQYIAEGVTNLRNRENHPEPSEPVQVSFRRTTGTV